MKLKGTEEIFDILKKSGYNLYWGSDFVDLTRFSNSEYIYVGSIYSDGKFKPCKGFPVTLVESYGLKKVK